MVSRLFTWNQTFLSMMCLSLVLSAENWSKQSSVSNLWGSDDDLESDNQELDYGAEELGAIEPGQLVAFERNKQNTIINKTIEFAGAMKSCEAIVSAAYKVVRYVPPFQNDMQAQFWKEKVIPVLVKSLEQDLVARSVITRSFGTVEDLVVVIQNVYKIIRRSRGSKRSIEIAKRNIPAALNKLNGSIARVNNLESNAITSFAEKTTQIFEIVGPETVKFAEKKAALDDSIRKKLIEQQNLISALGMKKGEVQSLSYLIDTTEKHVNRTDTDLQVSKKRREEINQLNDEIEIAIQNIPTNVKMTVTYSGSINHCFFWRRSWSRTYTVEVKNPNRESDLRYYSNILKSRVDRLQKTANDENEKQIIIKKLEKELAGYTERLTKAVEELSNLQAQFTGQFDALTADIKKDLAAKNKVDEIALVTFEKIGLDGNPLIEALTQVSIFSQSLQSGASVYSQFARILLSIKTLLEVQVELLSSDEPSDIFLAATLLIEEAKFLSEYAASAQHIMKTAKDYDERAIAQASLEHSGNFESLA